MSQLLIILIPLIPLLFWAWMFWEMTKNENLPPCLITVTSRRDVRLDWTVAFIFLSIVTAGYYYLTEYSR